VYFPGTPELLIWIYYDHPGLRPLSARRSCLYSYLSWGSTCMFYPLSREEMLSYWKYFISMAKSIRACGLLNPHLGESVMGGSTAFYYDDITYVIHLLPRVRTCAVRGKAIGLSVCLSVCTKIAISSYRDLGAWVTRQQNESIELSEKLASVCFKSRDTIHERHK
jgi:hypothetical protein